MSIKTTYTRLDELTNSLLGLQNSAPLSGPLNTPEQRASLNTDSAYYRSQIFTTCQSINPLIAAASPLLFWVNRHSLNATQIDSHLYKNLVHEMRAFESQSQNHGYRANLILAARYILCAWIDEKLDLKSNENFSLLKTFQGEQTNGEHFFVILERSYEDPLLYIDLIELIYLCLRFGFQGQFKEQKDGYPALDEITDKLYACIRSHRGELTQSLANEDSSSICEQKKSQWTIRLSTGIPSLACLGILSAGILVFFRNHFL